MGVSTLKKKAVTFDEINNWITQSIGYLALIIKTKKQDDQAFPSEANIPSSLDDNVTPLAADKLDMEFSESNEGTQTEISQLENHLKTLKKHLRLHFKNKDDRKKIFIFECSAEELNKPHIS